METFLRLVNEAKLLLTTGALLISMVTGGYYWISKYFVTTVYAQELTTKFEAQMRELKSQSKMNSIIINEMRMTRLENKIGRGESLTPTEKRVYDKLKKTIREHRTHRTSIKDRNVHIQS